MFLLLSIVLYSCHPLLTLCFQISPFTYEVVIPNGRISSEVVIHSSLEPNRLMCGSKCAALGFELCKGFNWYESESEEEDTALCELLAFVMENSVILNR